MVAMSRPIPGACPAGNGRNGAPDDAETRSTAAALRYNVPGDGQTWGPLLLAGSPILWPPHQNLWVHSGSGSFPSA
jgi:hypothetical protein